MELRPAALRMVLAHGLPAAVTVTSRSMEPTIDLGTKVDVAPFEPNAGLEIGDVVLIAATAGEGLILHRVMHVTDEGGRRLVFHQGDATGSTFALCAHEDVLALMVGYAGEAARPLPTLPSMSRAERVRFRRRRIACAAYARARLVARALGVAELSIVKRFAAAYRRLARAVLR